MRVVTKTKMLLDICYWSDARTHDDDNKVYHAQVTQILIPQLCRNAFFALFLV